MAEALVCNFYPVSYHCITSHYMSGFKPESHLWPNMIQVCLKERDGKIGTTSRYNCIVIDRWQRKSTGQEEMKNENIYSVMAEVT